MITLPYAKRMTCSLAHIVMRDLCQPSSQCLLVHRKHRASPYAPETHTLVEEMGKAILKAALAT